MNPALTGHETERDLDRPTYVMVCALYEVCSQITRSRVILPTGRETRRRQGVMMPKGPNGQTRPADVIGNAVHIAKIATGEIEDTTLKQPAKRASGLAGAKARQENTTEAQRVEIARAAAMKRWE